MRSILLALALLTSVARAEPIVLKMGAIAPEGTEWARQARAFVQDVEKVTGGQVRVKWYLGGIAGDELSVIDRIRRGQLDGEAGALFCAKLAPSLKAVQVVGLFQSRDEHRYVLSRLRARVDEEMAHAGFVDLGLASIGMPLPFLKERVATLGELKRQRLWIWSDDDVFGLLLPRMGLSTIPLPIENARAAADAGKLDGFIAIPSAALAYQWTTRVRYFMPDLPFSVHPGCIVVAQRSFDRLPMALQTELRSAGARMSVRFEAAGRAMDDALVGGLLEKQGLKRLATSDTMRSSFFAAARDARVAAAGVLVPQELLAQVQAWLADYRAEHRIDPARVVEP